MSMAGVVAEFMVWSSFRERAEAMASGSGDISEAFTGMGLAGLVTTSRDALREYPDELAMVIAAAQAILVDCAHLHRELANRLFAEQRIVKDAIYSLESASLALDRCRQKWNGGLDLVLVEDIRAGRRSSVAHETGFEEAVAA